MRVIYLLIIFGLIAYMSYEYDRFTRHYEFLEWSLNYVKDHCENMPR